jgi:MtaA/CmuA family methyltransferase
MRAMTSKQRYLAAVTGRPHDRTPITPFFMAWAAHHIQRSYRDYYLDAAVLADAQGAVAREFSLDQVSAISDPWREADAYGMTLEYPDEAVGIPQEHLLNGPDDLPRLDSLPMSDGTRTADRIRGVGLMAERFGVTHSVLGWVEGPVAEYCDLRGMEAAMTDFVEQPDMFHAAAEKLTDNTMAFAAAQLAAGADTIGVGDAAASLIGPALYREFALPWQQKLVRGIHDLGGLVKLHVCGNTTGILTEMAETGADILDLDWMVDLAAARQTLGPDICLAGNFDPSAVLLQGTPDEVAAAARVCIEAAGERFLLQPGCEVPPHTPIANIRAFCPTGG